MTKQTANRKPQGRPKLDTETLTKRLTILTRPSEHEQILAEADRQGISVNQLVRALINEGLQNRYIARQTP